MGRQILRSSNGTSPVMKRAAFFLVLLLCAWGVRVERLRASESGVPLMAQDSAAASKPVQDRAESDAYVAAIHETNPARKAVMLETFLAHYPDSVVIMDAFDQALALYASLHGDHFREADSQIHPKIKEDNVPAATVVVFVDRMKAWSSNPNLTESCSRALRLTQAMSAWQKPRSISEDQYHKLRNRAEAISNGMAGHCAYLTKSYVKARPYFLRSLQFDPDNIANLGELSLADLEGDPIDTKGFWYAARELSLSSPGGDVYPYGESKYEYYHGSREGWDKIVTEAATQTEPPPGFTVKRGQAKQF